MVASMIQLISNHYWHLKSKIRNFPPTTASTFLNFKGKPCKANRITLTSQWLKIRSYTNQVVIADCATWSAPWGPIAAYPRLPTLVWYSFLTVTCGVDTYITETTKWYQLQTDFDSSQARLSLLSRVRSGSSPFRGGETQTYFSNKAWKSSIVIANISAEANLLTCGVLTHFQGRHFTLQQSGNACFVQLWSRKLESRVNSH